MRILKTIFILFISLCGLITAVAGHTLSGTVRDATTGQALHMASVVVSPSDAGASTDSAGMFSLSLPADRYTVNISFVGYASETRTLDLDRDTALDISLEEVHMEMEPAVVTAYISKTETAETGAERLSAKDIGSVPALFGETDPLKVVQLTPGVQATSEGSSGFSVRGGNIDQNLILMDGATIYNASHMIGFFSIFNNDVLEDLKLYKGDIHAMYGGRLASLVDISTREGDMREYNVSGGIGLISSRLLFEGPIIKDKLSFLAAGRRTYLEVFKPAVSELRGKTMNFYDLNLGLGWQAGDRTMVSLSGYMGRDNYGIKEAGTQYGNGMLSLQLNHAFSGRFLANATLIGSRFDSGIEMNFAEQTANKGSWWMKSYGAKADLGYYYGKGNSLEFGYHILRHDIMKGEHSPASPLSIVAKKYIDPTASLEQALYVSNELVFGKFSVRAGLRLEGFYNISNGKPVAILKNYEPAGTETYRKGEIYEDHYRLSPRLGLSYRIDGKQTLKLSYTRTSQFLQMALDNASGLPINTWFESSPNIAPQQNDQFAAGYYRDIKGNDYEFSLEAYYKDTRNAVDFKEHSELTYNSELEQEIRMGEGYSYGVEVMLRKRTGKLNGWITWFFTRSMRKTDGVNQGRWYRSIYDKPVNIALVANYDLSDRWRLSANWVLSSGTPTTYPTGKAYVGSEVFPGNSYIPIYAERNNARFPTYHRLDVSAAFSFRTRRMEQSELVFSMYNAYGRKNPWTIYLKHDKEEGVVAEMYYLFTFTPSITWNFKF